MTSLYDLIQMYKNFDESILKTIYVSGTYDLDNVDDVIDSMELNPADFSESTKAVWLKTALERVEHRDRDDSDVWDEIIEQVNNFLASKEEG